MIDILTSKVLDYCGYTGKEIARKKHGSYPGCTIEYFINKLLQHDTGKSFIVSEGWGEQTFNRVISSVLVPIYGHIHGGNETWKRKLLFSIEYKECGKCKILLPFMDFNKDSYTSTGYHRLCKKCQSIVNKDWYDSNKDTYHKQYIAEHLSDYRYRNANRRAELLRATPSWADLNKIKEIYNTCPSGFHVDHIIPLKSDIVCGLHVENNLQHLLASENLAKSNKIIGGLA